MSVFMKILTLYFESSFKASRSATFFVNFVIKIDEIFDFNVNITFTAVTSVFFLLN